MDVPTGFDSLLASAGSAAGGRIVVAPPPSAASAPWVYEGKGKETWDSRTMPATPGKWTLTVTDPPDCKGCSYLRALLVRWIQP
jgi:hypothetical protein